MNEQLTVFVAGPLNTGKSRIVSSVINIPYDEFKKNRPFQELKNENLPITFIEANNRYIDELQYELESRLNESSIPLCWYILPGSIEDLSNEQETIECLRQYFDQIIFIFNDVDNKLSSKYPTMFETILSDPMIILLPSFDNTDSVISFESSLSKLIEISFIVIPEKFHETWQILFDMRQRAISHRIENKREKINFNGMELLVRDTDIGHLNIIIAGGTGTGKTKLINTVMGQDIGRFGEGNSVTHEISEYIVENKPLTIIDSPGFELGDQNNNFENLFKLINERRKSKNVSDHVHMMWYCINESYNRVRDIDLEQIKQICLKIPVIIVLTQAVITEDSISDDPARSIQAYLKKEIQGAATYDDFLQLAQRKAKRLDFIKLSRSKIAIHRLIAESIPIIDGHEHPAYGLNEFIELHKYYLPKISDYVFNAAQEINFNSKIESARNYVSQYSRDLMLVSKRAISESDIKNYQPVIQHMFIDIARVLDMPIQEGAIVILSFNILGDKDEKEDLYNSFKKFVFLLMGFIESCLISSGNMLWSSIGVFAKGIQSFINSTMGKTSSIAVIVERIGNNFIDTFVTLKNNDQKIDVENFIQAYSNNFKSITN